MVSNEASVYISDVDSRHFRIRVARALVKPAALSDVVEYCRSHSVTLLIARCLVSDLEVAQALEHEGFSLMDTLLYYTANVLENPLPQVNAALPVRPLRNGEEEAVREVAREAFHGYLGHYHADQRLDPVKCDEAYASWVFNCCSSNNFADQVLVAEVDHRVAGFCSLRLNGPDEGEGLLFGVSPWARKRTVYRSLLLQAMRWCFTQGASRMIISTQITNMLVQRMWANAGFHLTTAYYTFHKWFDAP
ncbi:MAG: GNAT family N-acetyltransferase [Syntrophorhabdales bacterium]|jgi:hypothetical protein